MKDIDTFASRMRGLRAGISTAAFAAKLGISSGALNNYERGQSMPSGKTLIHISEQLGVSVEWLLHGTEPEQKPPTSEVFEGENQQHIEITDSGNSETSDVGGFEERDELRALEKELRALYREHTAALKENAALRVEVERVRRELQAALGALDKGAAGMIKRTDVAQAG